MNTLKGISTNDDVGEAGTILEHENGVVTASVLVRVAWVATIELLVAKVLASSNNAGLRKRNDLADTGRDVESLRRGQTGNKGHKLNLRELHVCCVFDSKGIKMKSKKNGCSMKE